MSERMTPRQRAIWRVMQSFRTTDQDEASYLLKRTFEGQLILLQEQVRELGRAIAKEAPFRQLLVLRDRAASWLRRTW